jgi:hypothetical protein
MLNEPAPKMFSVGYDKNGVAVIMTPVRDEVDLNGTYQMVYQVEHCGKLNPAKVEITFNGGELHTSWVQVQNIQKQYYRDSGSLMPFEVFVKHNIKDVVIAYCYTEIFGDSPKTRKLISENNGIPPKSIKRMLRNKKLVRACLAGYCFLKIENGKNGVLLNDVIGMTEAEIEKFMEGANEINPYLFKNEQQLRDSLKDGYVTSVAFSTDTATIGSLH